MKGLVLLLAVSAAVVCVIEAQAKRPPPPPDARRPPPPEVRRPPPPVDGRRPPPPRRSKAPRPPTDFASPRMNQLWRQAKHKLAGDEKKLRVIFKDLKEMDRIEADVRNGPEGKRNGIAEKALRNRIVNFFENNQEMKAKQIVLTLEDDSALTDPDLKKLWANVKGLDLTETEFRELQNEFIYSQEKIDELEALISGDAVLEALDTLGVEIVKNMTVYSDFPQWMRELFNETALLKAADDYAELAQEVAFGFTRMNHQTNQTIRDTGFKEPMVVELWLEAKKTGMPDTKLQKIYQDLKKLEANVKKAQQMSRKANNFHEILTNKDTDHGEIPIKKRVALQKALKKLDKKTDVQKEGIFKHFSVLANAIKSASGKNVEL